MPIYPPNPVVAANIADGRISITNSIALPQGGANVTHAAFTPDVDTENTSGTIYYTPYTGNRISLFDGTGWRIYTFDATSSFSLTAIPANQTYDMFAFVNNGVVALEIVSWGINTEYNIIAVTVGANTTVTFTEPGGTQPFAANDVVEIQGAAGTSATVLNQSWAVSTVGGSGTSRTVTLNSVNTTGLTYTGLGTIRKVKNTRATALAVQDGVYVKTGDPTRKYLGTFRTTGAGQLTQDFRAARYIWNYYNRRPRQLFKLESTNSWTYGTQAWRALNNNAANRVEYVCGVAEDPIKFETSFCFRGPAPAAPPTEPQYTVIISFALAGIGVNKNLNTDHVNEGTGYLSQMSRDAYTNIIMAGYATMAKSFEGYNFASFVEYGYTNRAGTVNEIYGYNALRAAAILGLMWG